jgi:uvrD/REP family helicase
MEEVSFQIYNASAGSGKTFTLVKSFLRLILATKNVEAYKSLLAITFTNKAVNEMKERVINKLLLFSTSDQEIQEEDKKPSKDPMFRQLAREIGLTFEQLRERSKKVLNYILHNYAGFTIVTIDGFNQRLIRSFAFDLKLNPNFEVFLETDDLLRLAIENLLKKTEENKKLTKFLLEFSKDKIEEDKSWDIEEELFEIARLLTNENHYPYVQELKDKELEDFENLKKTLKQLSKQLFKLVEEVTAQFFSFSQEHHLSSKYFIRGSLYNFFEKIRNEGFFAIKKDSFDRNWFTDIAEKPLYSKDIQKKEPVVAQLLDENQAWIADLLQSVKKSYWLEQFYKRLTRNVTLLAVLKNLQEEILDIKEQENILPISEFNSIIHQTIINEPFPFIYEKIGIRYQHYFIDEFQDTSILQWENMLPLIADAVHSENLNKQHGSLLLVGDAKQSIYRWRGGRAEQFIDLYNKDRIPFYIEQQVVNLEYNYRSGKEVIAFNNDLFAYVALESSLFQSERYKKLYEESVQKIPEKGAKGGFVSIEFVEKQTSTDISLEEEAEESEEEENIYIETIEKYIKEVKNEGYSDKDICILSRRNKECTEIAEKLASKGYNVISSEALLLKNVPEIQFLIHLIAISLYQNNEKEKIELLFSYAKVKNLTDIHMFMSKYAHEPVEVFFLAKGFSLSYFHLYSFYEGIGYAIQVFGLAKPSDAYLSQFLNVIYEYKSIRNGNIADFPAFWEEKADKLAITAPEGVDAITIMTIHKSKGLEFPVVIYTHVNDKLRSAKDTLWIEVAPEKYNGFKHLLIDDYEGLEEVDANIVLQQSEMELLDTINTMYVAMTRPKDVLYVISDLPKKNKKERITNLSELLKLYLESKGVWQEGQARYTFGKLFPLEENEWESITYIPFKQRSTMTPSYTIVTNAGTMWNTENGKAIERGNLLHEMLGKIITEADIPEVLQQFFIEGRITEAQINPLTSQLKEVVTNPLIRDYYTSNYIIYNEREWLDQAGEYLRPDRVAYQEQKREAIIIDYKTGNDHPQYQTQLKRYAQVLEQMGWRVEKSFLVFINEEITVKIL